MKYYMPSLMPRLLFAGRCEKCGLGTRLLHTHTPLTPQQMSGSAHGKTSQVVKLSHAQTLLQRGKEGLVNIVQHFYTSDKFWYSSEVQKCCTIFTRPSFPLGGLKRGLRMRLVVKQKWTVHDTKLCYNCYAGPVSP